MDNLGNYLTIKQAKKFLSEKIKYKVSKRDLFELAARGEINLCMPFDGDVAEFKYNHPNPIRVPGFEYKLKNAFIKIPSESINLTGGIVHIYSIEVIEVVTNSDYKADHPYYGGGCESLPRLGNGLFFGKYIPDPENSRKIKFSTFEANSDNAVIPKQDLLDFIESKKTEQPEPRAAISETNNDDIPGKQPRTAIGKLAINAAWTIEQTTKKRATANEVIQKLQELELNDPILLEKLPHGVVWVTTNGKEKSFDIQTCTKALETWNKSRA